MSDLISRVESIYERFHASVLRKQLADQRPDVKKIALSQTASSVEAVVNGGDLALNRNAE